MRVALSIDSDGSVHIRPQKPSIQTGNDVEVSESMF